MIIFLFVFAGLYGKEWDYSKVDQIKIRETTRADIYKIFGEPWMIAEKNLEDFDTPVEGWSYYHQMGMLTNRSHSLALYFHPEDRTVIAYEVKTNIRGEKHRYEPEDKKYSFAFGTPIRKNDVTFPSINSDGTVSDLSPQEERQNAFDSACAEIGKETGIRIVDSVYVKQNRCRLLKTWPTSGNKAKTVKKAMKKGATHIVWTSKDMASFMAYQCEE